MVTVNPHIGWDESGHEPINPDWIDLCADPSAEFLDKIDAWDQEPVIARNHPALMHTPPVSEYDALMTRLRQMPAQDEGDFSRYEPL
jgi:hypothetical protein